MKWILIAASMLALNAHSAEITVMSTGAVKAPFTDASAQWSKDTGHKVSATFRSGRHTAAPENRLGHARRYRHHPDRELRGAREGRRHRCGLAARR